MVNRTALHLSFRRSGASVLALLRNAFYLCGGLISDAMYIGFGPRPKSSNRQEIIDHVVKTLKPPRRTVVISKALFHKELAAVATEMQISGQRARLFWRSGLLSIEIRLLFHGIDLLKGGFSDPPGRESLDHDGTPAQSAHAVAEPPTTRRVA